MLTTPSISCTLFVSLAEDFNKTIQLDNHKKKDTIGQGRVTQLVSHDFKTIELGGVELSNEELLGNGGSVDTTEPLNGKLQMVSSVGAVEEKITFERAP